MTRVIVIDGSGEARALCTELELEGYDVAQFANPEDALCDVKGCPPDVVFIELMIPGTTGLAFARVIRDRCPGARVVLTGAYHLSERQLVRADCGAIGFVPKPYGAREVASFLQSKIPAPPSYKALV